MQKGRVKEMRRFIKQKSLLAVVFALSMISGGFAQEPAQGQAVSPEEYAVYSVLLSGSDSLIVIKDQTGLKGDSVSPDLADYFEKTSGITLDKAMMNEFSVLNSAASLKLENKFDESLKVRLISEKEEQDIFKEDKGWEVFRQKYPNACLIGFSRVAFNAGKDLAFVYTDIVCNPMAGNGQYLLLKKEKAKWVIVTHVRAWIS